MKSVYEQFYSDSYNNRYSVQVNKKSIKEIKYHLRDFPFSKENKILDVACGVSVLGKIFGNHVWGMDFNPQAERVARKNGIRFKRANAEHRWPYPNKFFDVVIASHIIEHMVNPDHLILEAKRVLKKDGILVIITPNLASWFNRILLFLGYQPFLTEVSTVDKTLGLSFTKRFTTNRSPVGHLRVFTLPALKDIVYLHGFRVKKICGFEFGSFPHPLGIIDKLISRITPLAASIMLVSKKI